MYGAVLNFLFPIVAQDVGKLCFSQTKPHEM